MKTSLLMIIQSKKVPPRTFLRVWFKLPTCSTNNY